VAGGGLLDESVGHAELLLPAVTAPSHASTGHRPRGSARFGV